MKLCVNKFFASLVVAALVAGGCSKVDDTLGQNLIPYDDQMTIRIDTLDVGFETYVDITDSVSSNLLGALYLGNRTTPLGVTTCSGIVQFVPLLGYSVDTGFGTSPVVDSLYIGLSISLYSDGDDLSKVNTPQEYYVYEVTSDIKYDSIYYPSFPVDQVINPIPIFKFTASQPKNCLVKLEPINGGEAYMQRLVPSDMTIYEDGNDTLFIKEFKGWYIAPAPGSTKNAALVQYLLGASTVSAFVHSQFDGADSTYMVSYTMDDDYTYMYNNSIAIIDHDYSTAPFAGQIGTGQATTAGYVQTMTGVYTKLKLTPTLVSALRNLKSQDGIDYAAMVINQASLLISSQGTTAAEMNNEVARLGAYTNYVTRTGIPDYIPSYEITNSTLLPFGGFLDRGHKYYSMDVTTYTQRLAAGDNTASEIILAPEYASSVNYGSFGESVIAAQGGAVPGVRLVVTYTLIK